MSQQIAVIQYNAGNIHSVLSALHRLGFKGILTDNPEIIKNLTQPVLGICLGMQLLCKHSEEKDTDCLGIIPLEVKKFIPQQRENVPHVGWNTLLNTQNLLFEGLPENSFAYFVHSYYATLGPETIAQTDYIFPFSAAVQKDNFYATQFHPEKSGWVGEKILGNFLNIAP